MQFQDIYLLFNKGLQIEKNFLISTCLIRLVKKTLINQYAIYYVDQYEIIRIIENVYKYQNTSDHSTFLSLYPTCILVI